MPLTVITHHHMAFYVYYNVFGWVRTIRIVCSSIGKWYTITVGLHFIDNNHKICCLFLSLLSHIVKMRMPLYSDMYKFTTINGHIIYE